MTEYHKIDTLYERDEKTHKLQDPLVLRNPIYANFKKLLWTEKIDGTNIRISWNTKKVWFDGREKDSMLPASLVNYLMDTFSMEKFRSAFPNIPEWPDGVDGTNTPVILFGEGCGGSIQAGGNYSPSSIFVLFDVLVDCRYWLSQDNVEDVARKLGILTAPVMGEMSVEEATEMVKKGFPSILAHNLTGSVAPAEGLIGRPPETMFNNKGERLICKLKTKDFARAANLAKV